MLVALLVLGYNVIKYQKRKFFDLFIKYYNNYLKGECHPGVVVLDSPLTTYKEKDKKNGEDDESVGQGIKGKFYTMLADEETLKQIIIFDNEEPSEEVKGEISYLHFSGEASIGRKGFIPE